MSGLNQNDRSQVLAALRSRCQSPSRKAGTEAHSTDTARLLFGLPSLDTQLSVEAPPLGSVIEIASPSGLSGATRLALSACAAIQQRAEKDAGMPSPWCAWIDASQTLFAPGAIHAGVNLERLLVVRPEAKDIAAVSVRLANSRLFSLLIIDRNGIPGAEIETPKTRWDIAIRRLALALEGTRASVLLLSNTRSSRRQILPTAMRIELSKPNHQHLELRVAKNRAGLSGRSIHLPLHEIRRHERP